MGHIARVGWVDVAKGIGIILVVVGHTNRGLASSVINWSQGFQLLDDWIYSFHMPLFFFLSGLFLIKASSKPYSLFLSDKIRTIVYPYLIWSAITILLKSALGSAVNNPRSIGDLPLIFYAPVEQYWFLYVLFVGIVLLGALYRSGLNPWFVVLLACIALVLPFTWSWGVLYQVRTYAIYLALGAALGIRWFRFASQHYLAAIIVIGFSIPLLSQAEPFAAFAGISATIALAILASEAWIGQILSALGRYSLEIYVSHSFFSASIRMGLLRYGIDSPPLHIAIGILFGLLLPIMFSLVLQRLGFRYGFTIPSAKADARRRGEVSP